MNSSTALASDNRVIGRIKVFLLGSLELSERVLAIRIRDLSETGASAEADVPPEPGENVIFARGSIRRAARVTWSAGSKFGIRFERPIPPAELLLHIGQANRG